MYDEESEWQLPEPAALMMAKAYRDKKGEPLDRKLKEKVKDITIKYIHLLGAFKELQKQIEQYKQDTFIKESNGGLY